MVIVVVAGIDVIVEVLFVDCKRIKEAAVSQS
jgi:hypothetical protein